MIKINIEKAKAIAHDIRREKREKEFEPLDSLIAKQLPGLMTAEVEAKRQPWWEQNTVTKNTSMSLFLDKTTP